MGQHAESEEGAGALLFVLLACLLVAALFLYAIFHLHVTDTVKPDDAFMPSPLESSR